MASNNKAPARAKRTTRVITAASSGKQQAPEAPPTVPSPRPHHPIVLLPLPGPRAMAGEGGDQAPTEPPPRRPEEPAPTARPGGGGGGNGPTLIELELVGAQCMVSNAREYLDGLPAKLDELRAHVEAADAGCEMGERYLEDVLTRMRTARGADPVTGMRPPTEEMATPSQITSVANLRLGRRELAEIRPMLDDMWNAARTMAEPIKRRGVSRAALCREVDSCAYRILQTLRTVERMLEEHEQADDARRIAS